VESEKRFACQLKKHDGTWETIENFYDLTVAKLFLDRKSKSKSTAARIQNTVTGAIEYEIDPPNQTYF